MAWTVRRMLSKVNYKVHTDAVKKHLIPPDISKKEKGFAFASEADLLNLALFGITAKEWKKQNSDKEGNIRDYASLEQLIVLANLESYNSILIEEGYNQNERLEILNKKAQSQMKALNNSKSLDKAKKDFENKKKLDDGKQQT